MSTQVPKAPLMFSSFHSFRFSHIVLHSFCHNPLGFCPRFLFLGSLEFESFFVEYLLLYIACEVYVNEMILVNGIADDETFLTNTSKRDVEILVIVPWAIIALFFSRISL